MWAVESLPESVATCISFEGLQWWRVNDESAESRPGNKHLQSRSCQVKTSLSQAGTGKI